MRWLTALALMASTPAMAAEYRSITLANGRTVPAEIGEITATEMVLITPQGQLRIAPNELRSMDPLSSEGYAAVPPWKVLVLPFKGNAPDDGKIAEMYVSRVLQGIPAIQTIDVNELPPSVGETTRRALAMCGTDLQCATRHGSDAGVDIVIMGQSNTQAESKRIDIGAVFVDTPEARHREIITFDDALLNHSRAIAQATYKVMFLTPPTNITVPETVPVITKAPAPEVNPLNVSSLDQVAWTPVPGITALKQGNNAGFITAVGVVTAGTAASVAWSGYASYSAPQMIAMNAITGYGLTVLVNHIFIENR